MNNLKCKYCGSDNIVGYGTHTEAVFIDSDGLFRFISSEEPTIDDIDIYEHLCVDCGRTVKPDFTIGKMYKTTDGYDVVFIKPFSDDGMYHVFRMSKECHYRAYYTNEYGTTSNGHHIII